MERSWIDAKLFVPIHLVRRLNTRGKVVEQDLDEFSVLRHDHLPQKSGHRPFAVILLFPDCAELAHHAHCSIIHKLADGGLEGVFDDESRTLFDNWTDDQLNLVLVLECYGLLARNASGGSGALTAVGFSHVSNVLNWGGRSEGHC